MFNKDFRPRRLRTSDTLRRMVRETRISADSLIWPIFIIEGEGICDEIPSLPGQYHYSPDMLGRAVERMRAHGVSRVLLFGLPKHKDENGSSAWDSNGVVQQGIRALRAIAPELYIITDVCMCEYTSHGHCGILCGHYVDNDRTLEVLARTAVSHARAGADMVAPRSTKTALSTRRSWRIPRNSRLPSTARSATPQALLRRSATAVRIRWTPITAVRLCANASSMCRRARTF